MLAFTDAGSFYSSLELIIGQLVIIARGMHVIAHLHQAGGISPPLCRMDGMEVLFLVFPMNTFAVVTDPIMRELFRECGLMGFLDQ